MAQETTKVKRNKFNLFAKLGIGLGVLYLICIGGWFAMQTLEIIGTFDINIDKWVEIVYYVIFIVTSMVGPAWVAMLAISYIGATLEKGINLPKYKANVIAACVLAFGLQIISAIFSLIWAKQPKEGLLHWSGYVSTGILIANMLAILYGIILCGVGLNKVNKK